eukprot:jgi/Mesen1/1368/ME000013S00865
MCACVCGCARAYFPACVSLPVPSEQAQGVPSLALVLFCSEGDNVGDSLALADRLSRLLGLSVSEPGAKPAEGGSISWRIPRSWAHVYGPPPDLSMFG